LIKGSALLDRQAVATLVAGVLLLAISVLTHYGHGAFTHLGRLDLDDQVGLCLHAAALAALLGDAQLATRVRDRARDQALARRQQEARRRVALFRFQLADTPSSRLQMNEALAVLLEESATVRP
jgi:hypothetical protein